MSNINPVVAGGGIWTSRNKTVISSGVSNIDFESNLSGFDSHRILGRDIELDTAAHMQLRFKIGGSYKTGGTDYEWALHIVDHTSAGTAQDSSDSLIRMTNTIVSADANSRFNFNLEFDAIETTAFHVIRFDAWYTDGSIEFEKTSGSCIYQAAAAAIEGIRIFPSTGNMDAGNIEHLTRG